MSLAVEPASMKIKLPARRHHYLPQSYLAAFTDTGTKDGQFFVMEVHSGRSFRTSPINVAVERDFNRIDIEGKSPDSIELALASFEERATQAIRNVIERGAFPNGEDCNLIINLIGLMAVRNPYRRKSFNRAREAVMHRIADLLVSDKKIWDHHLSKAREAGEVIKDDVSFEEVKRFIGNRKYRIEFSPEGNLRIELRAFNKLLPILGQRTWSLLVAPMDGAEFICSDHPVTLVKKNRRGGPFGFGSKETEVFCPLGRKIVFYGVFEAPLRPVIKLKPKDVAIINLRIALNAERHVFSAMQSFALWHERGIREVHCGSGPQVEG